MADDLAQQRDAFYRKMGELLNAGVGSLQGSDELKKLKSWDSLAVLEFIVLADEQYGSDVQPAEIAACRTIDDLADLTFRNVPAQ